MTKPPAPRSTAAFQLQAMISFAVSSGAVMVGIAYLPVDARLEKLLAEHDPSKAPTL